VPAFAMSVALLLSDASANVVSAKEPNPASTTPAPIALRNSPLLIPLRLFPLCQFLRILPPCLTNPYCFCKILYPFYNVICCAPVTNL